MRTSAGWWMVGSLALIGACGGDGGTTVPTETPTTATVTGVVREEAAGTPVAGAAVSAEGVSTTTDLSGQFELRNIPLGSAVTFSVVAAGFEPVSRSHAVRPGVNSITILLPVPQPKVTLTGVVLDETLEPVAAATVSVGNVTTTTGADGSFELKDVSSGSQVTVMVNAAGFNSSALSLAVVPGNNSVTLVLFRANTIFEADGVMAYLPADVQALRGILFPIYGGGVDSRPMLRADFSFYSDLPYTGDVRGFRQRVMNFARTHGFAVLAGQFTPGNPERILNAVEAIAAMSGRAGLSGAPLLLYGGSLGACVAYELAAHRPERVVGFIVAKTPCLHTNGSVLRAVPGYFIVGGSDSPALESHMRAIFAHERWAGAAWAFAVEPYAGHAQVADQDLLFNWLADVAARRLAEQPGAELRPMTLESGWFGDEQTLMIGEYRCLVALAYPVSWLPSERSARDWQAMVSDAAFTAVASCSP